MTFAVFRWEINLLFFTHRNYTYPNSVTNFLIIYPNFVTGK